MQTVTGLFLFFSRGNPSQKQLETVVSNKQVELGRGSLGGARVHVLARPASWPLASQGPAGHETNPQVDQVWVSCSGSLP